LHEEDSYNNATKENLLMPKVAIFFSIILLSTVATNSYAFTPGDMVFEENTQQIQFDSDIIQIDQNIGDISDSVKFISEASSQLNALMLPIIASIGLIVALQITILARRR